MKRFKEILWRVLKPHTALIFALTPLSMALMIFVFVTNRETTIIGYISHGLSAYTLTVLVINMPVIYGKTRRFINNHRIRKFIYNTKIGNRLMTDLSFRALVTLYIAVFTDIPFAVFKLIAGIYYASFWYGADAIFYIVLSALRFSMLRHMRKKGEKQNLTNEYKQYRFCGSFFFVMNLALTGVVFQIVHQNMGYEYPGLLIYIACTYTFICLSVAIGSAVKYRKLKSPVISAVKSIGIAKAAVAIFALQTAMLASFGGETTAEYKRLFNSLTGGGVCLFLVSMALFMIIRANKYLRINNSET